MRKNRLHVSLFVKIITLFLTAILPLCLFLVILYSQAVKKVRNEIFYSTQKQAEFHLASLENAFGQIYRLQGEYINDFGLNCIGIASQFFTGQEKEEALGRLQMRLYATRNSTPYMLDTEVYISSMDTTVSIADKYRGLPAYMQGQTEDGHKSFGLSGRGDSLVCYSVQPALSINNRPLFRIFTRVDCESLLQDLSQFNIYENSGSIFYCGSKSLVLQSQNPPLAEGESLSDTLIDCFSTVQSPLQKSVRIGGKVYLATCCRSELLDASLILYLPEEAILKDLDIFRQLLCIASALSFGMCILFSLMVYKMLYYPLNLLLQSLRRVEEGENDLFIDHRPHDEFQDIYKYFNDMVKKSQRLAVQIYEQQLENDRSRYKQLQSQINPHFLYNSLFIIYRLAKMEDCDTIAYFSQKLGEYFRYVTRSGRDEVPLSEELVHVRSYVEIQTIRFANRIQVHFEALPAHLQSLPVPRLILQPIVENCYEHGFEDQPEGGEIDIRFHEDAQGLCILVENTGSTIEAGKIEQICADIHTDSIRVESTGVVNVGRRLRLRYGERGRLRMEPRKGGGVRVSLYIPYAGGEGGKNEV